MEKLISMTAFLIAEQKKRALQRIQRPVTSGDYVKGLKRCEDYATLLQRPLELSMFIPCNEKGEPMEKPMDWDLFVQRYGTDKRIEGLKKDFAFEFQVFLKYQKALDKVKFSGWEKGSSAVELTEEGFYLKYNGDDTLAFWSVDNQEFELKIGGAFNTIETIEKLINLGCILTLTEACKKQLGL